MISSSSSSSASSYPITPPPSFTASEHEDEYERASAFLRDFHSRQYISDANNNDLRRMAPLYTITESDEEEIVGCCDDDVGELGYEFSLALGVVFDVDDDAASSPARMKKTVKSECLFDLANNGIYSARPSSASSSSCSSVGDDLLAISHDYQERCYDSSFNDDGRGMRKMAKRSRCCIHC